MLPAALRAVTAMDCTRSGTLPAAPIAPVAVDWPMLIVTSVDVLLFCVSAPQEARNNDNNKTKIRMVSPEKSLNKITLPSNIDSQKNVVKIIR